MSSKSTSSKDAVVAKRKKSRIVHQGIVRINARSNTTFVTITDLQGNVLVSASPGKVNFKGSRKSTPFAAARVGEMAAKQAREQYGMTSCAVLMKGCGPGKESAAGAIHKVAGIDVTEYTDMTRGPHGGCRAKKKRRC